MILMDVRRLHDNCDISMLNVKNRFKLHKKKKTNDNLTTFEAIMMVQRANLVETAAFYNRSILCLDAISGRNL